jgi:hypothetical protein
MISCRCGHPCLTQDRRLDLFLSAAVAAMHSQQNFYKATEIGLTRLIGMAKSNVAMRQWIFARRATLRWMADWLRVNVRPPAYYAVRCACFSDLCVRVDPLPWYLSCRLAQ